MFGDPNKLSLWIQAHRLGYEMTKVHSRPVNGKTRPHCYLDGVLISCVEAHAKLVNEYKKLMKIRG